MSKIDFSDIALIKDRPFFNYCPVCHANVRKDDPYCTNCCELFRRDVAQKGYPEGYDESTYKMIIWQKRRVIHRDYKLGEYDKAERDRRMQELLEYAIEAEEQRKRAAGEERAKRQKFIEEQRRLYEDLD